MDQITTYITVFHVKTFQNDFSVTSFQAWLEQVFTAGHLCGVGEMLHVSVTFRQPLLRRARLSWLP